MFLNNQYIVTLRRNPQYRKLWFATVVSMLGDWFNLIASAALIGKLTESGMAVGGMFLLRYLCPLFMGPFAGVVIDRMNRKHALVIIDLIRALTMFGLLLVQEKSDIWLFYLLLGTQYALSSFFFSGRMAILPQTVSEADLGAANTLNQTTFSVILCVGSALGGVVASYFGIYTAFVVDAVTFIVSALILSRIRLPKNNLGSPILDRKIVKFFVEMAEGFSFLRKEKLVAFFVSQKALFFLVSAGGFDVLRVSLSQSSFKVFGDSSLGFAVLMCISAVGCGFGPVIGRTYSGNDVSKTKNVILLSYVLTAVGSLLMMSYFPVWSIGLGVLIHGLGAGTIWVFSSHLIYCYTENNIRGRVFSIEFSVYFLGAALGVLWVSMVVDISSTLNWALGLNILCIVLLLGLWKKIGMGRQV